MYADPSTTTLTDAEFCELGLREQIDILSRYVSRCEPLDPGFLKSHALMIVQLSDDMAFARQDKSKPH